MDFSKIKTAVAKQFSAIQGHKLFRTQVDKDELWDNYLGSFPDGTNQIYRERTKHDCNYCKQFIRAVGNVVAIIDGKLVSIWDIEVDDQNYQVVANSMAALVKSKPIENVFFHTERTAGIDKNYEDGPDGVILWNHFFVNIPPACVNTSSIGTALGEARSTFDVFNRGLKELTADAFEAVIDLISQNSLHRGAEFKAAVEGFYALKQQYDKIKTAKAKELFAWQHSVADHIGVTRIRNTAIGTLLIDLSEGVELDKAVDSFESKVSGNTYKRPNAVYTEKMKLAAAKEVEAMGLTSALSRRRAVMSDISVNNVLFADRDVKPKMAGESPFDMIDISTSTKTSKKLDKVEEVSIDKFVSDILPSATGLEIYLENNHIKSLVSLVAPVDPTAGKLFKWDNNFSWAYNGGVADSFIKERVKAAGGNVDAEVCFRLAWYNHDDLDLHMIEPDGREIYYGQYRKGRRNDFSPNGGQLDVDMNAGGGTTRTPVENIYYSDTSKMKSGRYKLYVNQYNQREKVDFGFEVEVQIRGEVTRYSYNKPVISKGIVIVIEFDYDAKTGEFKIVNSLKGDTVSKEVWGLKTNEFHKVSMMMLSPNHWDGQGVGSKHFFFMLNGCQNEETARGFFNEFLCSDLNQHRKVFEALGSKMLTTPAPDELSGVGFSSTQRASVLCRVTGSFSRTIKILF